MQIVKDLSVEDLRALIAEVVEEKLQELLGDPDEGLTLRVEVRDRLVKSLKESRQLRPAAPAAEVARRFGMAW